MAEIATAIDTAWRDYNVDGVPASGRHKPLKSEIRSVGDVIEEIAAPRPENFNALAGDNSTDAVSAWESLLSQANGRLVQGTPGATYYVSRPIVATKSINLDLNGAKIRGPAGVLVAERTRYSYTAGAYFTTVQGMSSFTLPVGVTIVKGDLLRLESDTVRETVGTYLYGTYAAVVNVSAGIVIIDVAFEAAYSVDRIYVMEPLHVRVVNGAIDVSGAVQVATGNPAIGIQTTGMFVTAENLSLIGGDYAGIGLNALGHTIRVNGVRCENFKDMGGVPAGGRLGYGVQASGVDVEFGEGTGGSRCKHVLTSATRNVVAQAVRMRGVWGHSPKGNAGADVTTQDGQSSPLYQQAFDIHANVEFAEIGPFRFDGVNSVIAIRNGRAKIHHGDIVHHGSQTDFRQDFLVNIYERAVDEVRLQEICVNCDALGVGDPVVSLTGIEQYWGGAHGDIVGDGISMNGGRLFSLEGSANAPLAASISINSVRFTRVSGVLAGGIRILGDSSPYPLGAIGDLEIRGDFELSTAATPPATSPLPAIRVLYVSSLRSAAGSGSWTADDLTNSQAVVDLGTSSFDMTPPTWIDFSNTRSSCWSMFFNLSTASATAAGPARFHGVDITHNGQNGGFSPGVYTSLTVAPSGPWTFNGARIIDANVGSASANCEDVRASGSHNLDLSGAALSRDPGANFTRGMPGCIKIGSDLIRIRTGTPDIYQDANGELYAAGALTTGVFAVGARCWESAPAGGGVPGRIHIGGGTWKTMAVLGA